MFGCSLIGQIVFNSGGLGANHNMSGKLGMKLAILKSHSQKKVMITFSLKEAPKINMRNIKINKNFEHKIVNTFLPISFNICFGCSKEPPHLDVFLSTHSICLF